MNTARESIYTVVFLIFTMHILTNLSYATTLQGNNMPLTQPMTTSQVKEEVKKKHKGRIISIKRKATRSHPNCHIVKMVTAAGEFKYIRYACGR